MEPKTISEMLRLYEIYNKSKKRAPSTLERLKYSLGLHFKTFMGAETPCTAISQEKLDEYRLYLIEKDLRITSINDYLRDLGTCLSWAKSRGHLVECPSMEFLEEDEPDDPIVFDEEEYQELLKATELEKTPVLRTRAKAMTMLLYTTGIRASELCGALWSEMEELVVEGETSHILRIKGAKKGKKRIVVILPDVWKALKDYREELAQPHGRGAKIIGSNP